MIIGLDTSVHNHSNNQAHDWEALAAGGVAFAMVRATVGRYYQDPWLAEDIQAGQAAGVLMTAYHVLVPGQDNEAQVKNFLTALGNVRLDWSVVMDWEVVNAYMATHGQACYDYHAANLPRVNSQAPVCYTNVNVGNMLSDNRGLRLVIANPGPGGSYNNNPAPSLPRLWQDWVIWQRSWTHQFPGIADPTVDLDEYRWSIEAFREEFNIGGSVPPPPPPGTWAWTKSNYNIRNEPLINPLTDFGNTEDNRRVKILERMGDWRRVEAWIHKDGLVE